MVSKHYSGWLPLVYRGCTLSFYTTASAAGILLWSIIFHNILDMKHSPQILQIN